MEDIITCIDIGSSKVCVVIARPTELGNIEILGKAIEPCSGAKRGIITDPDSVSHSITTCIQKLRALVNIGAESAYINLMGQHTELFYYKSSVAISGQDGKIISKDIKKAIDQIETVKLPKGLRVVNIVPRHYIVDGRVQPTEPIGISGTKLEIGSDIIAGKDDVFKDILNALQKSNITPDGFIAEALAIGETALNPEEKQEGTILIDVGGGVTNVSIFKDNNIVLYDSVPVGGEHITNDLSVGLDISLNEAEKLKREHGIALTSIIKNDYEVIINEFDINKRKTIKATQIAEIIEARVHELFTLCREKLEEVERLGDLKGGIVLAGGGIFNIDGSAKLAKRIFGLPTSLISHRLAGVTNSEHLTATAILKYVAGEMKTDRKNTKDGKTGKQKKGTGILNKILGIFSGLF